MRLKELFVLFGIIDVVLQQCQFVSAYIFYSNTPWSKPLKYTPSLNIRPIIKNRWLPQLYHDSKFQINNAESDDVEYDSQFDHLLADIDKMSIEDVNDEMNMDEMGLKLQEYLDQELRDSKADKQAPDDIFTMKNLDAQSKNKEENSAPTQESLMGCSSYALFYKFKEEYCHDKLDPDIITAHEEHCEKYDRLVNSEFVDVLNSKGVVTLWVTKSRDDNENLVKELDDFVASDPLMLQGIIETSELALLYNGSSDQPPPTDTDSGPLTKSSRSFASQSPNNPDSIQPQSPPFDASTYDGNNDLLPDDRAKTFTKDTFNSLRNQTVLDELLRREKRVSMGDSDESESSDTANGDLDISNDSNFEYTPVFEDEEEYSNDISDHEDNGETSRDNTYPAGRTGEETDEDLAKAGEKLTEDDKDEDTDEDEEDDMTEFDLDKIVNRYSKRMDAYDVPDDDTPIVSDLSNDGES
jgi:hypothetical protein